MVSSWYQSSKAVEKSLQCHTLHCDNVARTQSTTHTAASKDTGLLRSYYKTQNSFPSFHGLSNNWMISPSWVGEEVAGVWGRGGGVKPRPSLTNLLWDVSSINHLLLEVRACIHTSVSGVETKGSVVCCLFLFLLSGCDEEAVVLKCFRQRWDEKEETKKSFYTAYSNDIIFFPQRLTAGSASVVTTPRSNRPCNWNNRLQFHKHKCA